MVDMLFLSLSIPGSPLCVIIIVASVFILALLSQTWVYEIDFIPFILFCSEDHKLVEIILLM
jgi:hypothetical protein